jgi:hypothetical protein
VAFVGALVFLAACAETPEHHAMPPPQMLGPGPLGGHWMVSDVFPSGLTPLPLSRQKALEGRILTLSASEAEDVDGRHCSAPSYQFASVLQSRLFAYRQAVPAEDPMITEVSVHCHGAAFARFVMLASGTLLADHHGTWAALTPVATADPQMIHDDGGMIEVQVSPLADPTPIHSDREAHLASYRGEGMAREGWSKLTARYPALHAFSPRYETVTLGKKGTFIRLMAVGGSAQQITDLCHALHSQKAYSRVMKAP